MKNFDKLNLNQMFLVLRCVLRENIKFGLFVFLIAFTRPGLARAMHIAPCNLAPKKQWRYGDVGQDLAKSCSD